MKIIRPFTITTAALTSNVPETDHPEYVPGTTYAADVYVIVIGDTHKIYQSLQPGNMGNDPATSPLWWLDCGATNRWKMFDTMVDSQTVHNADIEFSLAISGRCNAIALLNVYASSIRVVATDVTDGTVFDRTINMRSDMGINDLWSYFFESPEWKTDMVITDLPLYSNMTVTVTLHNISGSTKCGAVVAGITKELGVTQFGAGIGITDYSVKSRDTWGNATLVERAYNKHGNYTLQVDNTRVDTLQSLLAGYRATPILYLGDEQFGSTMIFGFYKDFSIVIQGPASSVCTIDIEGLI